MKFSINRTELANALSIVLKGVSTRSTLPVLSGILIEAAGDKIILQATDLELSIQYSVAALVEEEGRTVVPGKLFSEIVKNLPDAAVHIEATDEQAFVTCDTSSFSIRALNAEDFPGFPRVDVHQKIEIPFHQFSTMVKRVSRVVSKDESRAILTGVLITLEAGGSTYPDNPHEGEEFGYVLQGSICIHLGNKTYRAKKGESFYFTPDKKHYLTSRHGASLIWVSTPPSF